ncbi:cupin domain-containing protein [Paenibacillus sp. GCM10023252]|uniref:cupin domain-containing protein n=1 Tax=Paenibacillus sp. GCM10023252 TaxID=3252649 RepID=UPI003605EC4B
MPLFQSGIGQAPSWCELEFFEIISLKPGEQYQSDRVTEKEKLIVTGGRCRILVSGQSLMAEEGTQVELVAAMAGWQADEAVEETTIVRMCGRWGDELGGSGIFRVAATEEPKDKGDAVSYLKKTNFDSHFHDCDEYWIVVEGRGAAVSEGKHYEVNAGDCIATGRGYHHDFPIVYEPVKAVYFETTMEGLKRQGHLWEHTHGLAEPVEGRG